MTQKLAPEGFNQAIPYLTVDHADQVLGFVVPVFDAEVVERSERPDGTIAHAAVRIGDSMVEVAESSERFGHMPGAIHVYVADVDAAHRKAMEHGGHSIHEPMDMEYGERSSAIRDPVGNHWYIATLQS